MQSSAKQSKGDSGEGSLVGGGDSPSQIAASDDAPTVISAPTANENPAFPRLVAGMRLGNFEILDYVGGGGMGRVFRARDPALARIVAIKVLSQEHVADQETVQRFLNEAQSTARLNHENIVRVYYSGQEGPLHYIVYEFIEGPTIRSIVEQKGQLSLSEAISYTFQVAEALAHAADHGITHRDIKPSNILITQEGQAKLIDMGLARLQKSENATTTDLTASGITLGTFDYISPEQAIDPRTVDVRSDIYSLGCTLFYMLTARLPFPQGNVLQKLLQHQGEEPPDVCQFRPRLPEEVSYVVRKMMAKDPRRRYQTPAQLMSALAAIAQHAGLAPVAPAGRALWGSSRWRTMSLFQRHLPWLAPVIVLILTVLALDFFWSSSAPPETPDPIARPQTKTSSASSEDEEVSSSPVILPPRRTTPKPKKTEAETPSTTRTAAP